jgi:hypothetical protein
MRLANALLPIALLGIAACDNTTSPPSGDLDGKWGWVLNGNPGGSSINLSLVTAGPNVAGAGQVCGAGAFCGPGPVSVAGQHVPGFGTFSLTLNGGGRSIAYSGQFKGRDTLQGTWVDGASSGPVTLARCTATSFCW